jgi:hypothetical protein
MKKFVIFLLIFTLTQVLFSQQNDFFKKNTILTGGLFSFDLQKTNYPDAPAHHSNSGKFESDFYLGYFIFNHFALGLKTHISTYKEKLFLETNVYKSKYSIIAIGPFIRYSTNFKLFIEADAEYGFIKQVYGTETNRKDFAYSAGIGYSFFLSNSVALEPQIKYKYYHLPSKNNLNEQIRNGLNFSLGLQIYLDLERKK